MKKIFFIFLFLFSIPVCSYESTDAKILQSDFIEYMKEKHGFDRSKLQAILDQAIVSRSILDAISRPAEKKLSWYKYRDIFIQEKRIREGVEFRNKHLKKLKEAEKRFGVPAEIITAIIGVETFYGRVTGTYRVIDSLNTLAFHYPKRANFFRGELEQFLLLTREQRMDPFSLKGSYAGAMGLVQFISSSYRHYAIDFDNDSIVDIWNNPDDAIGSVANYFFAHGWKRRGVVISKAHVKGEEYKTALGKGLEPNIYPHQLKELGIIPYTIPDDDEKLKLFEYEFENSNEYWLAHHNFYVITRYNHSELYAMAVYRLAMEIKKRTEKSVRPPS